MPGVAGFAVEALHCVDLVFLVLREAPQCWPVRYAPPSRTSLCFSTPTHYVDMPFDVSVGIEEAAVSGLAVGRIRLNQPTGV